MITGLKNAKCYFCLFFHFPDNVSLAAMKGIYIFFKSVKRYDKKDFIVLKMMNRAEIQWKFILEIFLSIFNNVSFKSNVNTCASTRK